MGGASAAKASAGSQALASVTRAAHEAPAPRALPERPRARRAVRPLGASGPPRLLASRQRRWIAPAPPRATASARAATSPGAYGRCRRAPASSRSRVWRRAHPNRRRPGPRPLEASPRGPRTGRLRRHRPRRVVRSTPRSGRSAELPGEASAREGPRTPGLDSDMDGILAPWQGPGLVGRMVRGMLIPLDAGRERRGSRDGAARLSADRSGGLALARPPARTRRST